MYVLVPVITYSSPRCTALVVIARMSVQAPGSVIPMPATHSPLSTCGRYRAFCSAFEQ